jgi:hypothetical protein
VLADECADGDFAAFGSFAILVFADFGGPRRVRLVA